MQALQVSAMAPRVPYDSSNFFLVSKGFVFVHERGEKVTKPFLFFSIVYVRSHPPTYMISSFAARLLLSLSKLDTTAIP